MRGAQQGIGRRALLLPLLALTLGASASAADAEPTSPPAPVEEALKQELSIARDLAEVQDGLMALEQERASIEYAASILEHGGRESLRRLHAYRAAGTKQRQQARRRARALYKLARGGMIRIVFGDSDEPSVSAKGEQALRIRRGRTMAWIVRHDLEEFDVYRRAERRVRGELLGAARELQALSALRMIQSMERLAATHVKDSLTPVLEQARGRRRGLVEEHGIRGAEQRKLLFSLRREHRRVRRGGSKRSLAVVSLHRPTRGAVVGRFGDYHDRILRLPMHRNGIELSASRGEKVRAVGDGEVSLVGALPGYDKVVVVDHGDGYVSLLGRLMDVRVLEGERVQEGTLIGRAAPKTVDDGLGRTVYLELRHADRPINPAPLLRE
jgi:septal ring factor EnvC (AmiA/AmiB activator)